MGRFEKLVGILILVVSTQFLIGCDHYENNSDTESNENTIVVLNFKAQTGKGEAAVSGLKDLFAKVKDEPNFVSIKLHVDPNDDTNIMLYEEWEDLTYYQTEHMNTAHLKEFMVNSSDFLTGPPEVTFWKLENVYK